MPSAALVTITYSVQSQKASQYEPLMRDLVQRINATQQGVRMSLYKSEDGDNNYVEVYECDSADAFDSLEDNVDDETRAMITRVSSDFATARQHVAVLRQVI